MCIFIKLFMIIGLLKFPYRYHRKFVILNFAGSLVFIASANNSFLTNKSCYVEVRLCVKDYC